MLKQQGRLRRLSQPTNPTCLLPIQPPFEPPLVPEQTEPATSEVIYDKECHFPDFSILTTQSAVDMPSSLISHQQIWKRTNKIQDVPRALHGVMLGGFPFPFASTRSSGAALRGPVARCGLWVCFKVLQRFWGSVHWVPRTG